MTPQSSHEAGSDRGRHTPSASRGSRRGENRPEFIAAPHGPPAPAILEQTFFAASCPLYSGLERSVARGFPYRGS